MTTKIKRKVLNLVSEMMGSSSAITLAKTRRSANIFGKSILSCSRFARCMAHLRSMSTAVEKDSTNHLENLLPTRNAKSQTRLVPTRSILLFSRCVRRDGGKSHLIHNALGALWAIPDSLLVTTRCLRTTTLTSRTARNRSSQWSHT